MRRFLSYIIPALVLIATSCSKVPEGQEDNYGKFVMINGSVTDTTGTPIEHIRITVETELLDEALMLYSSSTGIFHCEIPYNGTKQQMALSLLFEDIDGEDNAGLFQSKTDNIRIFMKDYTSDIIIIDLKPYRLTHATASGNNPQF